MANFYKDSAGYSWGVMMQEKTTSCGPASVAMTEVYYKSNAVANLESQVRALSNQYPGYWKASSGTDMSNLVYVLRARGIKCYDVFNSGPCSVWNYIYKYANDNTPVIVHINWGTGSHFAPCVYVYKKTLRCIFLDPWYGLVEVFGPDLPQYMVVDPTGNFPPVAKGSLSGYMIITKR